MNSIKAVIFYKYIHLVDVTHLIIQKEWLFILVFLTTASTLTFIVLTNGYTQNELSQAWIAPMLTGPCPHFLIVILFLILTLQMTRTTH